MHFVLEKPLASYRQFNSLEVRISVEILSFILSNKTGLSSVCQEEMQARIVEGLTRQGEFFMFQSGSKMTVHTDLPKEGSKQKPKSRFYIYGYHYAGNDIRAAVEALRYGHAIYKAHQHRENYRDITRYELRIEKRGL